MRLRYICFNVFMLIFYSILFARHQTKGTSKVQKSLSIDTIQVLRNYCNRREKGRESTKQKYLETTTAAALQKCDILVDTKLPIFPLY